VSVESALSQLNIPVKKKLSNHRILTNCFLNTHEDSTPSLMIDLTTGIYHCFSCKVSSNITKLYQEAFNISYKEAQSQIFGLSYNFNIDYVQKDFVDNLKKDIEKEIVKKRNFNFCYLPINGPEKIDYLYRRGWNKDFIEFFNIQQCISDEYMDYAIIPVVSEKLNIYTFEARKIFELKYLQKLFHADSNNIDRLKAKFNKHKSKYKDSIYFEYLEKSKTLYPYESPVDKLIFNYDNLDFNQDLILVEGIGSISKIWNHITKNVTCCFGSKVSNTQINLLRQSKKRILVVSDNDLASYLYLIQLNFYLDNVYVYDCYTNDTSDAFVNEIKNSGIIKANDFVMNRDYETLVKVYTKKYSQ